MRQTSKTLSTAPSWLEHLSVRLWGTESESERMLKHILALVIGMIVMMWPALTKVQYEKLPAIVTTRALWEQLVVSIAINWVIGPFVRHG